MRVKLYAVRLNWYDGTRGEQRWRLVESYNAADAAFQARTLVEADMAYIMAPDESKYIRLMEVRPASTLVLLRHEECGQLLAANGNCPRCKTEPQAEVLERDTPMNEELEGECDLRSGLEPRHEDGRQAPVGFMSADREPVT